MSVHRRRWPTVDVLEIDGDLPVADPTNGRDLDMPGSMGWIERVAAPIEPQVQRAPRRRQCLVSIDEQLRAHPGIGEILLDRMLSTDRRILNAATDILVDAGFDDTYVLMAYAVTAIVLMFVFFAH